MTKQCVLHYHHEIARLQYQDIRKSLLLAQNLPIVIFTFVFLYGLNKLDMACKTETFGSDGRWILFCLDKA